MTAAKLKELVDAMEREKYDTQEWHNARFMLQSYLTGHAQDFIRLMEAASAVKRYPLLRSHIGSQLDDALEEALAAFKEKE